MPLSKPAKQHIAYGIILIVVAGCLLWYVNVQLNYQREEYTDQIQKNSQELAVQLTQTRNALQKNLDALDQTLKKINESTKKELGVLNSNFDLFKEQNQKEINTLSSLIDTIEQQSNIQLNQLKTQLKDIAIKSADFSAIIDDVLPSVVSVNTNTGLGSGVVISDNGYIVTNYHVINGASQLVVKTYGGKSYAAQIIGSDTDADISVLKIDASVQSLPFGDSASLKIGSKVIALGNPAGLSFSVTEGIISATRKLPNGYAYLQTDVPINPGNSGGPLIDQKGEIVGINNFKVGGFEGLGFAIASDEVSQISGRIISEYESIQSQ